MYTPNVHLDAAHQRLRHATSDELNVDAPPQHHPSAPTSSYDAWQYLSQGLSSLPNEFHLTAQHSLSPPVETYGLNPGGVHLSEKWPVNSGLLQTTSQGAPHHLPTPPAYNTQQLPQPCVDRLKWTEPGRSQSGKSQPCSEQRCLTQRRSVPNGLPLSPEDYLPQTRTYPTSGPGFNTLKLPIWNVDGNGGNHEDWVYNERQRSELFYQAQVSEDIARYGTPPMAPHICRVAPIPAVQSRRASSVASSPILAGHHGQFNQLPALQEWRTGNLTSESRPELSHLARHSYSP